MRIDIHAPPSVAPSTSVHPHAPSTPFQCLKRGESLTYGIGETLTYGDGVTQTDFWGLARAMMCILQCRKGRSGCGRGTASTMEEVQLRQWKRCCFGSGRGEFLAVIVLGDLNRRKIPSAIVAFDDGSVPKAISWHFLLAITDFCRTFAAEKESEGGDTMSHRCQGRHTLASFLSVATGDQPVRRREHP